MLFWNSCDLHYEPAAFSSVPTPLPHIKSGRLRALAVTLLTRSPVLPDLPKVQEATELKGFEVSLWQGIVAPAARPLAFVLKLNQQMLTVFLGSQTSRPQ